MILRSTNSWGWFCHGKFSLFRNFSRTKVPYNQVPDHIQVQEMMDSGYTPPDNYTVPKPYKISKSLLASWRQQRKAEKTNFKDVAVVKLRSGNGGNGKISFLRDSGRSVGPPDGGDGGPGGHVYIQASNQIRSLAHLRHIYKAADGRTGGSTQLTGKKGANVVLQVPVGTHIRWAPPLDKLKQMEIDENPIEVDVVSNWSRFEDAAIQIPREQFTDGHGGWMFREQEEEKWRDNAYFKRVIQKVKQFDLINRRQERNADMFPYNGIDMHGEGEPILLLSGGVGGLGNMHFQSPELRSPSFAKQGRFGCEMTLILELKMLADLGLVGLPNSGKSTLLRSISRARPKVGDYEFTTLVPSIGSISLGIDGTSFSVADIPGIIKDAHLDKGLGLGFLRHIERCNGLAFVISLDKIDPVADLLILISELGTLLNNKKILLIATKADLPEAQMRFNQLSEYAKLHNWPIVPCSALNGSIHGVVENMAKVAGKDPLQ